MEFFKIFIPVCLACFCNASANTLWKLEFSKNPINFTKISELFSTLFNLYILGGILFYMLSMFLFFYLLSNYKLSVVIPLTGMTYFFNIISAYFIFNENVSKRQLIGTVFMVIGIILISKNQN